jgi:small subunit ribosomal protein S7e
LLVLISIKFQRRIIPKPLRGKNRLAEKQKRPRSRTLTAVHEGYLADLVFPAEVVGKRIRIKLDGKQVQKIHLDKAQQTTLEHKVDTFSQVYKTITGGKDVTFEFPDPIY